MDHSQPAIPAPTESGFSRRRVLAGGAAGIGTLVLPSAAAAASVEGSGTPEPQTYTQTFSADGTFTVPTGVTALTIRAEGSAGGLPTTSAVVDTNATAGSYTYVTLTFKNGTPGAGGDVSGTVSVTPSETLYVVVGGTASAIGVSTSNDGTSAVSIAGGKGGAGIGIRSGSTWLVVAGGGGGAGIGGFDYNSGNNGYFTVTNNYGGDGGAVGVAGSNGVTGSYAAAGGGGATTSASGSGGAGYSIGPFNGNGSSGTAKTGTALGAGGAVNANGIVRGGAGGSGYYGGGAGGSNNGNGSGAGGGGGSNYTDSGRVTSVATTASTRTNADGALLTISYTV